MRLPNPRRYRRLLAARRERARRNHRRELRHEIARCERLLDETAEKRDAEKVGTETGKIMRRMYARLWMRTLVRVAKLEVELMMAQGRTA